MVELTKVERSILLYAECCLVDNLGRLEGRRMNGEDIDALKSLKEKGIVLDFGRLAWKVVEYYANSDLNYKPTHFVRLTDEGWKLVHQLRREKSERLISKQNIELLRKT
jgi:hypothetical protein